MRVVGIAGVTVPADQPCYNIVVVAVVIVVAVVVGVANAAIYYCYCWRCDFAMLL